MDGRERRCVRWARFQPRVKAISDLEGSSRDAIKPARSWFVLATGFLVDLCCRFVGLVGTEDRLSIQWVVRHKCFPDPNIPYADNAMRTLVALMEQ